MSLKVIVKNYLLSKVQKVKVGDFENSLDHKSFIQIVNQTVFMIKKKTSFSKGKQVLIGIYLPRNLYYITSILSVWLCGHYFVPLNQKWPKKYLKSILNDCKPQIIISNKNLNIKNSKFKIIRINKFKKNNLEEKLIKLSTYRKINKLAYIIYTSGSSGAKKGVIISEKSLTAYMNWVKNNFAKKNFKSILITGELTFDILLGDLSNALMFHSDIYLTPDTRNTFKTFFMIQKRNIEAIYGVPSTLKNLFLYALSRKFKELNSLKVIFSGGDIITSNLYRMVKKVCPKSYFFNMYGPTEITINCLSMDITNLKPSSQKKMVIPAGKEFPHLNYKLIDTETLKIKKNEGELIVGGKQLMNGYLNRGKEDKSSFILINNKKYYRTGDIFKRDKNKIYYFLNRYDKLKKFKGFRVNTLAIDNILQQYKFIKDAKTFIFKNNFQEILVSFILVNKEVKKSNLLENYIIKKLSKEFPKHHLPNKLIILKSFFYNDRGKYNIPKFSKILKSSFK